MSANYTFYSFRKAREIPRLKKYLVLTATGFIPRIPRETTNSQTTETRRLPFGEFFFTFLKVCFITIQVPFVRAILSYSQTEPHSDMVGDLIWQPYISHPPSIHSLIIAVCLQSFLTKCWPRFADSCIMSLPTPRFPQCILHRHES